MKPIDQIKWKVRVLFNFYSQDIEHFAIHGSLNIFEMNEYLVVGST